MAYPAPTELSTKDLFRLDQRTIVSEWKATLQDKKSGHQRRVVSGGAGAVGSSVGKAILESGADAVFLDLESQPQADKWSITPPMPSPHVLPP